MRKFIKVINIPENATKEELNESFDKGFMEFFIFGEVTYRFNTDDKI